VLRKVEAHTSLPARALKTTTMLPLSSSRGLPMRMLLGPFNHTADLNTLRRVYTHVPGKVTRFSARFDSRVRRPCTLPAARANEP
jgi:hypothetical protein